MSEQVTPPAVESTNKSFRVDLYQSHMARSLTESFTVQAATPEEAETLVRKESIETKDLPGDEENKTWDLQVVDITPPVLAPPTDLVDAVPPEVQAAIDNQAAAENQTEDVQSVTQPGGVLLTSAPTDTTLEAEQPAEAPETATEDATDEDKREDVHTKVD